MKRELRKAEEGKKWRENANTDMEKITKVAAQRSDT